MRALAAILLSAVMAPAAAAQVPATPGSNQCFARTAGLAGMPGFEAAVTSGNALNSAADDTGRRTSLMTYDRALAAAIAAMPGGSGLADRLIKLDSIVDRIAGCAVQVGLGPGQSRLADAALSSAIARNAALFDPGTPGLKPTNEQIRLQHQIMNSARFKRVLAENGQGGRLAASQADIALRKADEERRAREFSARLAAEEAQRRQRYEVEAAAQAAYFRRQATAHALPDAVMVRRALIGELKATGGNTPAMGLARGLASMTERPGESLMSEYWGYNDGVAEFSFGRKPDDRYTIVRYEVSKVSCARLAGASPAYDCSFMVGGKVFDRLGPLVLRDTTSAAVPIRTRIAWDGSRWSAPELRGKMIRTVAATAVKPSRNAASSGQSGLCRSLNAGVAAAGGRSTSAGLDPQTWGC